jgi:multidrug efflux pump subunit AcrB
MIEPGPPTGNPLEVKVRGADYDTLNRIAGEIMAFLANYGGVTDIQSDYEQGKSELHIRVDKAEAARLGLDTASIAQTLFTAYQGAEATVVREGDEEIKVRVKLKPEYRDDPASLDVLTVANRGGRPIPLSRVVSMERQRGLPAVSHYEGDRVVTVSASFEEGISSVVVNRALEEAFADLPARYPGYDLLRGGEWKETRKLMLFMLKAFGMAMLLIYLVLAVQFNSMLQPFVVMAAIPLGMIGVVIALILHGKPVSIMAAMGMVGMAGVVVNDAIVLVKFVNDLRRSGETSVTEAIVAAGQKRLRPILLTSVTTIAGLMPVIYGWGGYEPFVAPAAITLAYGLLFATFLTLMVVPATYRIAVDAKRAVVAVGRFGRHPVRP